MALIDKASLLMVPSTYEDGTLYNVLPSGNKAPDETGSHNGYDQTRADFTFSRGSNLAATRVNSDGLIEKGRENLLLQSNQFDTTWVNNNTIETGGQTDKDGGTNAWKLEINGGTLNQRIEQNQSTSGVQTFSVYAKAGTLDWMYIRIDGSGGLHTAYFDLSTGSVGTTALLIDSNIEAAGNGFYRCSVTFSDTITITRIYLATANGNTTQSSGNIYIQNAQLEYGLTASSYLDSGATTATAGVLENTPRIDYSSGAGALLLESQRTNLITQSEYFGAWSIAQMSLEYNYATSPEGVQNATRLIENTAVGTAHSVNLPTTTTQAVHAFSVYAKPNGRDYIYMYVGNGPGQGTIIDIANGVKGSNVGSSPNDTIIEDVGNGWYKCTILFNGIAASVTPTIGLANTSSSFAYTGDGTSGVLIYGAMLETGSHVSSYVPTYGSAATRGADISYTDEMVNYIGQSEGTIYAEFFLPQDLSAGENRLSLSDNTLNNWIFTSIPESGNKTRMYVRIGASTLIDTQTTGSVFNHGQINKIAFAYKSGDSRVYVNGSSVLNSSASFGSPTSELDVFTITGSSGTGSVSTQNIQNEIKQFTLFKERLSNTELATLTTL